MRITKVHIASFGKIADRRFELSPGMTVFHGPNESGKTTLMEFIRNTLVPTRGQIYPDRKKTDSGSITVEDGKEKVITLTQRTRGGDVPECIGRMEPDLYRSIFALNQDDLDEEKLLSSGEIGQRFLTIPGSDGMIESMERVSAETVELLGKTASSPSRLNVLEDEIGRTEERIAELRSNAETYGQLADELDAERAKLSEIRESSSDERVRRDLYLRYRSQEANYGRLEQAKRDRTAVGPFVRVSQESVDQFNQISAERNTKKQICKDSTDALQAQRARLGTDPQTATDLYARMDRASREYSLYDSRRRTAAVPARETRTVEKPNTMLIALGLILVIAGLAGMLVSTFTVVLAGMGAVLAALGFVKKKTETYTVEVPAREDHAGYVQAYEREVSDIMKRLGRPHSTVEADLDAMRAVQKALDDYRKAEETNRNARQDFSAADVKFMRFLMAFGTEEKFRKARASTMEADRLDALIQQLRQTIADAGLDPDRSECPVEDVQTDGSEEGSVNKHIGELEERMKSVLDTEQLDALMDRKASLTAERDAVLRRGAVSYLASMIAERACDSVYRDVHPEVISTADRYLSMMTDGRYRFDLDPRNKGLFVRDGDGVKGSKQWSTGLRAQVLLSLKLAVAREMGDGEVPVILDDVLLPFDTDRKEGAVKALSEVSKEMQVIMFTCDDQTSGFASAEQGVKVVEM